MDAARACGITVANGQGTNDDCVADHAFELVIAAMRNFRQLDRLCREGVWRLAIPQPPNVSGKRIGILGLGTIGQKIVRSAAAFDMPIGYHNRSPKAGVAHRYFDSQAGWRNGARCWSAPPPSREATQHIVNAQVFDALATALRDGRIAGAGLDVYESEPSRPEALIGLDNVILTPHLAGWSPEATQAFFDRFLENTEGHFSGCGVVSPI